MSKLWIIGDSFTGSGDKTYLSWTELLIKKFKGDSYYVSSKSSRDFQTIFDIFLRNLKDISSEDLVILVVPTLERIRLPLKTAVMDIEESNKKIDAIDYFIGSHAYIPDNPYNKLDEPFTELKHDFYEDKSIGLTSKLWSLVNVSNSSLNNWMDIITSLKKYLPFELYIWSWTDEFNFDLIENKQDIINKIGIWETKDDIWQKTNGKIGMKGDLHFSTNTHKAFADYLIVKFPQFFNI